MVSRIAYDVHSLMLSDGDLMIIVNVGLLVRLLLLLLCEHLSVCCCM